MLFLLVGFFYFFSCLCSFFSCFSPVFWLFDDSCRWVALFFECVEVE